MLLLESLVLPSFQPFLYDIRSAYTSTSLADSYFWRWVEQSFSFFYYVVQNFWPIPGYSGLVNRLQEAIISELDRFLKMIERLGCEMCYGHVGSVPSQMLGA